MCQALIVGIENTFSIFGLFFIFLVVTFEINYGMYLKNWNTFSFYFQRWFIFVVVLTTHAFGCGRDGWCDAQFLECTQIPRYLEDKAFLFSLQTFGHLKPLDS